MQYLLLIYTNEAMAAAATPEQNGQMMGEYWAFTEALNKRGAYKGGEALHDTKMATTVRIRDGKPIITDGPFAETKEQLGGYYIIDVKNLDEAIEAAKIPGAAVGTIELRPIMELPVAQDVRQNM